MTADRSTWDLTPLALQKAATQIPHGPFFLSPSPQTSPPQVPLCFLTNRPFFKKPSDLPTSESSPHPQCPLFLSFRPPISVHRWLPGGVNPVGPHYSPRATTQYVQSPSPVQIPQTQRTRSVTLCQYAKHCLHPPHQNKSLFDFVHFPFP